MEQYLVGAFDQPVGPAGDKKVEVAEVPGGIVCLHPGKRDHPELFLAGGFNRFEHIGRIPRAANGHEQIAGFGEPADGLGKNLVVPEVIADGEPAS